MGYFIEHAQYQAPVQSITAIMNIKLPFQKCPNLHQNGHQPVSYITAIPYVRRLVATGYDHPDVLHMLFGDHWEIGIGPLHEIERRNYLFAAKASNWLEMKLSYDMDDGQTVPFLSPLQNVSEREIANAEVCWGQWLAMQDWMLGPRSPFKVENGHDIHTGSKE